MSNKDIPLNLSHKPIVSVDYSEKDAYAGDAKFLSIGRAKWDKEDVSAKIFRWAEEGERWSRQSEEMPLWRVLDLAKLVIATITGKRSPLNEGVVNEEDGEFLKNFICDNMKLYAPRIKEIADLLNSTNPSIMNKKVPNIFSFATSELSQDAMLAWLIKCADDTYKKEDVELCMLGKSLLSLLTGLKMEEIHSVEVGRQWRNIDIWAEINEDAFLVIEDKTETSIHDDQLNRYRKIVEDEYRGKRNKLFYAYVKTGNEPLSVENKVRSQGFKAINRVELLTVLNKYEGRHSIVLDYREHLQGIENATNNYRCMPVQKWEPYEWQGFYKELEKHISDVNWGYVPNPSGGFWGLWSNPLKNSEIEMYFQFEESKLCFKIAYDGRDRPRVRDRYYQKLMDVTEKSRVSVETPRFGSGTFMTIGIVPADEVFGEGIVDMEKLIDKLKSYEQIIKRCVSDEI
ncbi:MAG: PD-(D/E)XK nuclease family protein [Paludibacteraceae bacterium]|nr:PD-(D/E)XK nuclease family protein [Paludibacteraceae bacterium]